MITHISPREAELSRQIDEQGGQLAAWRDRAIAAEAELARLRAQVPVGWIGPSGFTHNTATNRMWMRESPKLAAKLSPVYAAPPAQPAEPVQRRPALASIESAPACLNMNDKAMWVTGWNECRDAIESALQPGWRDVESAPKDGRVVLLGKFNSHNKWRTMRGQWFSADAIAETWEDPDDAPEGWYETSVEAEDMPNVWYTEPTHWMPLPPAPKATK